jgi:hypothetical protein
MQKKVLQRKGSGMREKMTKKTIDELNKEEERFKSR